MNAASKAAREHYRGVRDAAVRMLRQIREDGGLDEDEFVYQLLRRANDRVAIARDHSDPALWEALTAARNLLSQAIADLLDLDADEDADEDALDG
ncbi:hypothetical protein [Reyranella sp.]|uniref:hypothetical protein n=1 Tax=Reyranella sp. TaxID=1929291 RepID=UPI0027310786|nr:hypothetical protein [Reyranella sp.]MDP2376564.1 hypothetical protein [Reyranella sp.]